VGGLLRILAVLLGLGLIAGGALYGILGVWGMTRGGSDAWILAGLGTGSAIGGGALILRVLRRLNEPS